MAQNERTGRGGRGGGLDRPKDPDTNPRAMHAEPPPESPLTAASEAGGPSVEPPNEAGDGGDGGGGGDGENDGGGNGEAEGGGGDDRTEEEVLAELQAAQKTVEDLEAELAEIREEDRREEEKDRIIDEYVAQLPALKAEEAELERYRTAELKFLEEMLSEDVRKAIAEVSDDLQQELNGLEADVDNAQAALDAQQRTLDEAKAAERNATGELERLVRPLDPVRAKLRDGEALRTATNKAEEAEDYATAFWLVMDGGRMQKRLAEDPIRDPDDLREAIEAAGEAQAAARADIPAQEAPIAGLSKALEDARVAHESAKATLEERVQERVSELNPTSAEPA